MNRKDINAPELYGEPQNPPALNAEDQVVPVMMLEPERAPRPKIFELIEHPGNIDEVMTYIENTPLEELMESTIIADNNSEDMLLTAYSYALYKERFDILRALIEVFSRESAIFLVNRLREALLQRHHIGEIELLVAFGADIFSPIDDGSRLAIIDLVYISNRLDVLDSWLNAGRLNLAADLKRRPFRLHQAVANGADLIVEKLFLCGVDAEARMDLRSLLGNDDHLIAMTPMETLMDCDVKSRQELLNVFAQHASPLSVCRIKANFSRTVMLMLDKGAEYSVTTKFGENLFHILALLGIDFVLGERLMKAGLNINQLTRYGATALHIAVMNGQVESLKTLLALGANPKIKDDSDRYPLYYSNNVEVFKILYPYYEIQEIDTQTDLDLEEIEEEMFDEGFQMYRSSFIGSEEHEDDLKIDKNFLQELVTRVMDAIVSRDTITVQRLIKENIGLANMIEKMRNPLLMLLIERNFTDAEVFRTFLSIGSNAKLYNDTIINILLTDAIERLDIEVCQMIFAMTPLEVILHEGRSSPVFSACQHNRLDVLQALESRGANIHLKLRSGLSTFHVACKSRSANVALYLMKKGADIQAKFLDIDERKECASIDLLRPMLDYDRSPFQPDTMRLEPMTQHIKILRAMSYDFFDDLTFLAYYYRVNIGYISSDDELNDLLTEYLDKWDLVASIVSLPKPEALRLGLMLAAIYGANKNLQTLLKHGADVSLSRDKQLITPLHWSVLYQREMITQILMKWGADITLKTQQGNTALQFGYNSLARQSATSYLKSFLIPMIQSSITERPVDEATDSLMVDSVSPTSLDFSHEGPPDIWQLTLSDINHSASIELKALYYPINLLEWPNVAPSLVGILGQPPSSTFRIAQRFSQGYYHPENIINVFSSQPIKGPSQAFTFETLVCFEAKQIAECLENSNPCRAALFDLSFNGFRRMQTSGLDEHFATPGLKLLYDHRDENTAVGIFVRCNLITIQRARKEILYKALIAHSLFKVCPNANIVNCLCGTITHDDIPQNDAQSSALMKMLPGTSSSKKQSGPQS